MGKQTKTTPSASVSASQAQGPVTYATPYDELNDFDEVVIEVGPKVQIRKGKVQEVEPVRNTVMTKFGYDQMDRDEETGDTKQIPTRAIGVPKYVEVIDRSIAGGKRTDMEVIPFEVPYPAPVADQAEADAPEVEETDEDEPEA